MRTIEAKYHNEERPDRWTFAVTPEISPNSPLFAGYEVALVEQTDTDIEPMNGRWPAQAGAKVFWSVYGYYHEDSLMARMDGAAEHIADRNSIHEALALLASLSVITDKQKHAVEREWMIIEPKQTV